MRGAGVCYSSPACPEQPIMSRDCDFAGLSGGVPVDCHANNNLRWAKWRWVMLLAANHVSSSPSSLPSMCVVPLATKLSRNAVSSVRVAHCTEYRHVVFRAQGYHDLMRVLEGTPITLFSVLQAVCCLGVYLQMQR
jgi:hypothetical protein